MTTVEETPTKGERQAVLRALLTAVSNCALSYETACVMIEHGADVNIRSDRGMSALEMADVGGAPKDLLDAIRARQRPAGL